ncbi:FliH/SctL family protein [Coralloluteibacterium stylophorae]|uniref:Flagellar assembly protein FliH n=1 Tax=Coralloluteibacterium stylophorae TaxID=1776034 RepID=A0A8J7VVS2_9GAMM|nr:FliH/SctL family protein [Coralloluteibacterium stylophorae]MBS7458778.1 hypothetical protein [Coralloluteibacterium stylophorae]
MNTTTVLDTRAFTRAAAGSVLSAAEWTALADVDALLERINALHAGAEDEVAQARDAGYHAGFAEGLARAQQQMTQQLAGLNERRARTLAEAEARISELACAIVARIAPGLDAEALVPRLVREAVQSAQAEQFLLIRVHPQAREAVAATLGEVRQAHPAVGLIELVADESLEPQSCVVVSEAGEVRAGIAQQLDAIRVALAQASQAAA